MDWLVVLREHRIPFIEKGANVKRGEINIKCPMCGSADPSFHMGLNLESGFWACWRNREHRGKSPVFLLCKLLRIPYGAARKLAGLGDDAPLDPDGFDAVAARIMGRDSRIERVEQVRREFLALPREFLVITGPEHRDTLRHFEYLLTRDFHPLDVDDLALDYGIRAAISGPFKDRLILPYYMDGELVAWTGRAIAPAEIRYKDLSIDESLVPIKETLYNHDSLIEGGIAVIVQEGPIDALKVDLYGRDHGVRSVGLSTNSMSDEQVYLLESYAAGFNAVIAMMDNSSSLSIVDSMKLKAQLGRIKNLYIEPVPFGLKDGALLTPSQASRFTQDIARKYT